MSVIRITASVTIAGDGDRLHVVFNPPGASPKITCRMLFNALMCAAKRAGTPRKKFAEIVRQCADHVEAMTDQEYGARFRPAQNEAAEA